MVAPRINTEIQSVVWRCCSVSHVDHVTGEAVEGLLQRLRQRGVGVHVAGGLEGGEVPLLREGQLGQKLGDVRSDQVTADELEVLGVGDQLDEADGFAEAVGLAVRAERELGDLDLATLALACSSVRPKLATCGWQNVARGIMR